MTAPTAPFGQLLGQAQIVSRALFDRILTTSGTTFEHWVTLKYLADRGGSARRTELIEAVSTGLRTTGAAARSALDALIEAGLITSDDESARPPPGRLAASGTSRSAAATPSSRPGCSTAWPPTISRRRGGC